MMETATNRLEKNRESVRRWYARHREEYSALRRERYRKSPKLRAKARKAAAEYRAERRQGLRVQRVLLREIGGRQVEVYTSGYVADRAKVSPQVLRGWEARGWIPKPLFEGERHRLYTSRQVGLMRLLAEATRVKAKGRRKPDAPVLDEVINLIHKTWKVVEHAGENGQKASRRRR